MKIIEERYLKKEIKKLNRYSNEHRSFLDFFNNVDPVMDKTLQDLSFKSDLNFFKEIEFILSVITSIISHPHLVNKGEEIIVRAEQANHVSTEMFNKTMRDSTLWKENDQTDMVPEYVYYYQQIDELRIYENIFIVMLVKMIEQEINKYKTYLDSISEEEATQEVVNLMEKGIINISEEELAESMFNDIALLNELF